jgi:hypothetical protein
VDHSIVLSLLWLVGPFLKRLRATDIDEGDGGTMLIPAR